MKISTLSKLALATAGVFFCTAGADAQQQVQIYMPLQAEIAKFPQTDKGYWDKTYSCLGQYQHLDIGIFRLTHNISEDPESTEFAPAWTGFIPCTNSSTTDFYAGGEGEGWYTNQWGCMAGGGIAYAGYPYRDAMAEEGVPYIVADWASYLDGTLDEHICNISFNTPREYNAVGVYVCPAPWPYYGNMVGDGFARPLTQPGDIMTLTFHGVDAQGKETGSITHTLAQAVGDGKGGYRCEQNPKWTWVDLSPLGSVKSIYATMTSTDTGEWGINSATYFCMDRLTVSAAATLDKPKAKFVRDNGLARLVWEPVEGADSYIMYWCESYNYASGNIIATGVTDTGYTYPEKHIEGYFGVQAQNSVTGELSPVTILEDFLGAIDNVATDAEATDAPVEYYTLDGRRVTVPAPGLYIMRQGARTAKILIR